MYIRWQLRTKANGDVQHRAVLVESARVDGKPRQQLIAYLGSYSEQRFARDTGPFWRAQFLDEIAERLDRLSNRITPAERKRLDKDIAARVGRPTKSEVAAAQRRRDAILGAFKAGSGSKDTPEH
jgi:hypothetical protein